MRRGERSTLLRFAVLGALVLAVVIVGVLIFSGGGGHKYRLYFETASQLVDGNQVVVGGASIGSITDISLTEDNQAEVEIEVDRELHEGTGAVVRVPSLSTSAGRYISITPGPDNADPLPENGQIKATETSAAVDLDQFFNIFDEKARWGLSNFIRGSSEVYEGDAAEQANRAIPYGTPAFSSVQRLVAAYTEDEPALASFLKNTSGVVTALAERRDDLSELTQNANEAFGAIASENESLSLALQELPPTLRQANTTFVNLRVALDDVQPFIETTGRSTRNLAPFLKNDLRPVLVRARPVFANLAQVVSKPGEDNDANELTRSLVQLHPRGGPATRAGIRAMNAAQEDVATMRAYTPDVFGAFAKTGALAGYYDINGHYVRVMPTSPGVFNLGAGNVIVPSDSEIYGNAQLLGATRRCPGGATQAVEGSNPFTDGGRLTDMCDPSQVPPGP